MSALPPGVTPVQPEPSGALPPGVSALESEPATEPASPKRRPTRGLDVGMLSAKGLPYIGAPLGVLLTPGGAQAAKETARTTIPMAVGAATGGLSLPVQSLAQMGTTAAMQGTGLEKPSVGQILLSGALPFVPEVLGRLWRGLGRTATRVIPSRFEAAQKGAEQAGQRMIGQMRPTVSSSELGEAAGREAERVVGQRVVAKEVPSAILGPSGAPMTRTVTTAVPMTPTIPIAATMKYAQGVTLPVKSANPQMEAVRTTIGNLEAKAARGLIELKDLEAIRKDIGPLVGRATAPAELRALYSTMVRDLESAAKSGMPGAALARATATAFKKELGASMLEELLTQASPRRLISGATVPALNVASFANLLNQPKTKQALLRNLGPEALKQVDAFIFQYRNLPPDVAFNAANRLIAGIGATAGGIAGFGIGSWPGALMGALAPEVIVNTLKAGGNAPALNALLNTLTAGARGTVASSGDLVRSAGRGR